MQIGDVFFQVLERILDLDGKQATQTGAVFGGGHFGLVKHFHRDGVAHVDQGGKADERLAAFLDFQQLGQFAKGPGGEAAVQNAGGVALRGLGRSRICYIFGSCLCFVGGGWELIRQCVLLRVPRPPCGLLLDLRRTHCRISSRRRVGLSLVLRQLQAGQRLKRPARLAAQLCLERTEIAPLPHLATVLVHHADVHEAVGREHVDLDVGFDDVQAGRVAH